MSESLVTIEAIARDGRGKGYSRKIRREGKIPAVLLEKGNSVPLSLDPKLLSKAYKSTEKRFNLNFAGSTREVFIKEIQIDPVRRTVLHVDLMYSNQG